MDITEYDKFYKWYKANERRFHCSQMTEVQIAYSAYLHGIEQSHKHGVMQVPQFEELLQVRLAELPYTKHLDDGQYNDGQAYGFECGARWAYEKLSSGTKALA